MTSKNWVLPPRPKPGRKPASDSKRKAKSLDSSSSNSNSHSHHGHIHSQNSSSHLQGQSYKNRTSVSPQRQLNTLSSNNNNNNNKEESKIELLQARLLQIENQNIKKEEELLKSLNLANVENTKLREVINRLSQEINILKSINKENTRTTISSLIKANSNNDNTSNNTLSKHVTNYLDDDYNSKFENHGVLMNRTSTSTSVSSTSSYASSDLISESSPQSIFTDYDDISNDFLLDHKSNNSNDSNINGNDLSIFSSYSIDPKNIPMSSLISPQSLDLDFDPFFSLDDGDLKKSTTTANSDVDNLKPQVENGNKRSREDCTFDVENNSVKKIKNNNHGSSNQLQVKNEELDDFLDLHRSISTSSTDSMMDSTNLSNSTINIDNSVSSVKLSRASSEPTSSNPLMNNIKRRESISHTGNSSEIIDLMEMFINTGDITVPTVEVKLEDF